MKTEILPESTSRASASSLWMSSPMPMVTLVKTFDITRVVKTAKKRGVKFNALMCWCVNRAALRVEEFHTLPEKGKLYKYDQLAINVIVKNKKGGLSFCDIPCTESFQEFVDYYNRITRKTINECEHNCLDGYMVIGTSAVVGTEIDVIVNQFNDQFCNPMVMWGKYRKGWFKTTLPISFQFHHVQMDGQQAARFLEFLQEEINKVSTI